MKKGMVILAVTFILWFVGVQVFAADGDLYVNGNVGIGTTTPNNKLSVAGIIESTTGGVKFPDGSIQTTAGGSNTMPTLRAYLGSDQSLNGDAWYTMNINTVQDNTGGGFNTGTHVYTIPETGWYTISIRAAGSGCTYALGTRVVLNGTKVIGGGNYYNSVGEGNSSITSYLLQNDTLTFQVIQGNYNFTLLSGTDNTYIQVRKLAN